MIKKSKILFLILIFSLVLLTFSGCKTVNKIKCLVFGHSLIIYDSVEPGCTEDGYSLSAICEVCGHVEKETEVLSAIGHSFSEPTCQSPKICSACGTQEGEPIEHSLIEAEGKSATCTEDGYTDHLVCENCGFTKDKETVYSSGHVLFDAEGLEPTCTENGHSAYKACENCDYIENKEVILAGHTYGEPDENGLIFCTVCGEPLESEQ